MAIGILTRLTSGGWKARLIFGVAVVAALFVFAILMDAALTFNRVHGGIYISGMDVGRSTPEDAEAAISERVGRASNNSITLISDDGQTWHLLPADVDTHIDAEATVAAAMAVTRGNGFFQDLYKRFSLYFTTEDVPLSATVDATLLDTFIDGIAATLDVVPVNAGLVIEGSEVVVVDGKDGVVVDKAALRSRIKDTLFVLASDTINVPKALKEPDIQADDTAGAVAMAETMLSDSVSIEYEDKVWALNPAQIATGIDVRTEQEGDHTHLVPYLSPDKLAPLLENVANTVKRSPDNATWKTNGETATLVPATMGFSLDIAKTAEELTNAALSPSDRVAQAQGVETEPDRTTEEAEAMGIVSKLGSFTTEFGGSEGRRDNVQRAAALINGTLLAPGAEFDFDTVVGKRTTENGFTTAPQIIAGGKLEDALGGGICQVSTTLFNAVFFAGLDVTARRNHMLYISHYPKGRDATVSWGGPAFRFVNDTPNWILIKSASSRSSVTFVLYGTPQGRQVTYSTSDWYDVKPVTEKRVQTAELFQGQERVTDQGQTGKSVRVTRKVVQDGKVVHEDSFVSRYPMLPKIIEVGTKPTTTTTTKPPTTTTTAPPTSTTTTTTP
jgi:vancomycin resistance protein YoaR